GLPAPSADGTSRRVLHRAVRRHLRRLPAPAVGGRGPPGAAGGALLGAAAGGHGRARPHRTPAAAL
ncbi:MAG: hypothetical protein AVDCRST_MAG52-3083, partial [uncultured Blastococcus sp.]